MNKLLYLAAFAVGGAIGALGMYKYSENKFETRYQEDLASVKEAFSERREKEENEPDNSDVKAPTDGQLLEMAVPKTSHSYITSGSLADDYDYREFMKNVIKGQIPESDNDDESSNIKILTPEEFGKVDDYEKITLYYFQGDDILTDDEYEIIKYPESVIGSALDHFGEHEEDVVYVRNEKFKGDYEILLDVRKYVDFIRKDAYLNHLHGHETEEE